VAEPPGDPEALGRLAVNRAVLAVLREGAERNADGVGAWSPDGYVMRTHPDLTEVLGRSAPDDLRMVFGVATLVTAEGIIYAIGRGTSGVWLRIPSGPAHDDALRADEVSPVEGLSGWVHLRAWRDDLGTWLRASAILSSEMSTDRA
jgi:hypothetical protein